MTHSFHDPSSTWITHVYIQVVNMTLMVNFYHRVLGFEVLSKAHNQIVLGFEARAMITLLYSPKTQLETHRTQGLYHVAYLVPTLEDFACVLRYVSMLDLPLEGLADHGVSQAIYLRDPEGNGVEIYTDRDQKDWPYVQGQLTMVTHPLDVRALYQLSMEERKLPSTTFIGHMHLHVGDLIQASEYYQQTFAYKVTQHYENQAVFLSGNAYHHHLGLNIWNGQKIPKKNKNTSGLIGYRIHNVPIFDEEDPSGLIINPKNKLVSTY
jgi:catechol 2,3-dioxygenase